MTIEQRKYIRFLVKKDSYAALRNGFNKVGKIHDISVNGMVFSYLSKIAQVDTANHHNQVDIFTLKGGFHLFSVPCRIVYETAIDTQDEGLLVKMFRCGLHFDKLSIMQLDLLNFFIKKYTNITRPMKEAPKMLDNPVKMI